MPNPAITRIDFSTGAAVLYTADPKIKYTFPIVGKDQVPLPPAVIVDNSARIDAILASIADLKATVSHMATSAPAAPAPTGPAPMPATTSAPPGWTSLTLSVTDNLRAAIGVAAKGFKLLLTPGVYKQCIHIPAGLDGWTIASTTGKAKDVVLDGQGGLTVAQNNTGSGATRLAYGKGVIHAGCVGLLLAVTVTGGGSNATDGHDGQAGMYWDTGEANSGAATMTNCVFTNNQNGVFGNTQNSNINYVFNTCDFIDNSVDGGSHDTYLNGQNNSSATFNNCLAPGSRFGNNFKTRLPKVTMQGGSYGTQNANRWIELAEGGVLDIHGGVYDGNDSGQNVFGNGDENTNRGPGNTTWDNSDIYLGNRAADFCNAGTFTGTNLRVHANPGGNSSIFNSKGTPLTGLVVTDTAAAPALPATVAMAA